jgi:hypothetical protein
MAHHLEFARWGARFRAFLALALATVFAACDASDKLTEVSEEPTILSADPVDVPASLSTSFRGGIPMGLSAQPTSAFGSLYNGALRNIWPTYLRQELAAIRSRGGKVVLMFAGNERYYKTNGYFDLGKWKARVSRFRNTNFSEFIKDGTIVGHYLIDEPYDPANWNGRPVPGKTLEEMARYSKGLWPSMVTIVRAEPYLIKWSGTYRYLDAAWAQYLHRKGNVYDYIRRNVSESQRMGLGLVVGLNLRHGGTPNMTWMSADEVKNFGSALLSSSYPCAFISWQWNSTYLSSSAIKNAMSVLRSKAQNRASRSCRG